MVVEEALPFESVKPFPSGIVQDKNRGIVVPPPSAFALSGLRHDSGEMVGTIGPFDLSARKCLTGVDNRIRAFVLGIIRV